ncbi:MAG: peroxiredoxin [Lysobacterales bacterium]|jgi:peroxiredoxin Q/BCP|nr:MAG: peroxiredoxin [Xanthomonadales bacterium]
MPEKTAAVGRKVPDFSLPSTSGGAWKLSEASGRKLVIYFYPKDDTSGCTREGIDFRDLHPEFRKAGAEILGVSPDTLASHAKFKAKHGFTFDLLADVDKRACGVFDVIREKSMYGRKYLGVERSTFLVDAKGVLRREWRKVKVPGHAAEVLDAVREL